VLSIAELAQPQAPRPVLSREQWIDHLQELVLAERGAKPGADSPWIRAVGPSRTGEG
jgi:hypothetical protein